MGEQGSRRKHAKQQQHCRRRRGQSSVMSSNIKHVIRGQELVGGGLSVSNKCDKRAEAILIPGTEEKAMLSKCHHGTVASRLLGFF